jgi:hypothetical protein
MIMTYSRRDDRHMVILYSTCTNISVTHSLSHAIKICNNYDHGTMYL